MPNIKITDLEVFYCVGVTEEERAQPQRLLLTVDMTFDFTVAAMSDRLSKTIDYYAVAQQLLIFGEGRAWKLIERVAANIGEFVMVEFNPEIVTVEVKKFVIPQAAHVSVKWAQTHAK